MQTKCSSKQRNERSLFLGSRSHPVWGGPIFILPGSNDSFQCKQPEIYERGFFLSLEASLEVANSAR